MIKKFSCEYNTIIRFLFEFEFEFLEESSNMAVWDSFSFFVRNEGEEGTRERRRRGREGNERRRGRGEKGALPRIASHRLAATRRASSLVWFIVGDDSLGWLID